MQGADILLRHAFQPYRLPDTGTGSIPHTAPLFALFSVGLQRGQIIDGKHCNLIFTLFYQGCDIGREGEIPVIVPAADLTIDSNLCSSADSAEVQQNAFADPIGRQSKGSCILVFVTDPAGEGYSREQALRAERHTNTAVREGILTETFSSYGQIPHSVQTEPFFPHHLRPRINIPWDFRQGKPSLGKQFFHICQLFGFGSWYSQQESNRTVSGGVSSISGWAR